MDHLILQNVHLFRPLWCKWSISELKGVAFLRSGRYLLLSPPWLQGMLLLRSTGCNVPLLSVRGTMSSVQDTHLSLLLCETIVCVSVPHTIVAGGLQGNQQSPWVCVHAAGVDVVSLYVPVRGAGRGAGGQHTYGHPGHVVYPSAKLSHLLVCKHTCCIMASTRQKQCFTSPLSSQTHSCGLSYV